MRCYNVKRFPDFPRGEYEARYSRLQPLLGERGLDGLLVTSEPNVRYFTGLNTRLFRTVLRPIIALLPAARGREPIMIVPEVLEATCEATTWVEKHPHERRVLRPSLQRHAGRNR